MYICNYTVHNLLIFYLKKKKTDYGLSSFRKSGTLSAQRSAATVLESAMYRAPELRVASGIILPNAAADVYRYKKTRRQYM